MINLALAVTFLFRFLTKIKETVTNRTGISVIYPLHADPPRERNIRNIRNKWKGENNELASDARKLKAVLWYPNSFRERSLEHSGISRVLLAWPSLNRKMGRQGCTHIRALSFVRWRLYTATKAVWWFQLGLHDRWSIHPQPRALPSYHTLEEGEINNDNTS